MSAFKDRVSSVALEVFNKEWLTRQPLLNKSQNTNTGLATVSKLNNDGTVDVTLNGQTFTKVSPGSQPIGVGMQVQLVNGIQLVR